MKTRNILKCLVAVVALFTYSCSSDSDGDGGTDPGQGGVSGITSITVAVSSTSVEVGNAITFTVTGNDGTNVTSTATILVNNTAITGTSYTPTTSGTYTVKATYESITSTQLFVEVTAGPITALRIESNTATLKVGDTADFTVIGTDGLGNEYTITDATTISVNGTAIVGNRYMVTAMGDIEAIATKDDVTSELIMLPVTEETVPGTYAQNAVLEDYTGTWCGYCPRVSYAIGLVEADSDRVFAIAAHDGNGNPEIMQNQYSLALSSVYVTSGYPTAVINRDSEWSYPEPSNVSQLTNLASGTTSSGLSLNSILVGNQLKVYVSSSFAQSASGAKLVVFVLEDGIIAPQSNYTSYYGGVSYITNFEHNHVLRHSITDVFGDAISNTGANGKNTDVFDIPVPSLVTNSSKMSIVAMIVGSDNKVLNAIGAKVGVDKDYQAN
jgi:hypothetical protein